jgi:hypothetical protein
LSLPAKYSIKNARLKYIQNTLAQFKVWVTPWSSLFGRRLHLRPKMTQLSAEI